MNSIVQKIDDFLTAGIRAISKNADEITETVNKNVDNLSTGNKYYDEVAERIGKSNGNKVSDAAVFSGDTVKSGNRQGKMYKKDQDALKQKLLERKKIRDSGGDVRYDGNLGGVQSVDASNRAPQFIEKNGQKYRRNNGSWEVQRRTPGEKGAAFYEKISDIEASNAGLETWASPRQSGREAAINQYKNHQQEFQAYQQHNQRQADLNEAFQPRSQEELDKANRGLRQRTLDSVNEKFNNVKNTVTGQKRRQTTQQRREYNQMAYDAGQPMMNTNREFIAAQQKYNGTDSQTTFDNMMKAQDVSRTAAGDNNGLGGFISDHPGIAMGIAVGTGVIGANIFDDDDDYE